MFRRSSLVVVITLLAVVAALFSTAGTAAAAQAGPDKKIAAALERIASNTQTASDEALLRAHPSIAAQVPDNDTARFVAGGDETPATARQVELAGGAARAAYTTTCGHVVWVDLYKRSYTGSTIFTWRHQVSYCRNGLEVKSWDYRQDWLTQSQSVVQFKELSAAWQSGLSTNRATSYRQRHIEFCVIQYGCYTNGYPWSSITAFGGSGFIWDSGGL